MSATRFPLGSCVATPRAIEALAAEGGDWRFNAAVYLARHQDGDWGELDAHDSQQNELSVQHSWRILSAYDTSAGRRFWIITEADRSSTCILLPEEY